MTETHLICRHCDKPITDSVALDPRGAAPDGQQSWVHPECARLERNNLVLEIRRKTDRLNEAAPALLDACESAKDWINETLKHRSIMPGSDLILIDLEHAIRKARGL